MIHETVAAGVEEGVAPIMAWAVRDRGKWLFGSSVGPNCPLIFDLASLTKVLCTTQFAMNWVSNGLDLDSPISRIVPRFIGGGKERVTIRHLLAHESGMSAFDPAYALLRSRGEVVDAVIARPLESEPGTRSVYSDLGMILLGEALQDGAPLNVMFYGLYPFEFWFGPEADDLWRCVPTEPVESWRDDRHDPRREISRDGVRYTCGEVHDPTAFAMGGVAGHAGLFGSIFAFMPWVEEFLSHDPKLREAFTTRQSDRSSRALGWDTIEPDGSCWPHWGPRTYGHTGFTGTSLWIDPDADLVAVLLTNRVHPTAENMKIRAFRQRFHSAVWNELRA